MQAAFDAMSAGHNQYAPMIGVKPLREAISALALKHYGYQADPDLEITVTVGASEALFCAILAIVQPLDEVIILEPAYDLYRPAIINGGAIPVGVSMVFENNQFIIDWSAVSAAVTSRTCAIIINTPNNPTGGIFSSDDFIELEYLVEKHNLWVILDEVYEYMVFDGAQHQSALSRTNLSKRTIYIASFGKTLHVTGWKVGYVIAPKLLSEAIRAVHQFNAFSVATPLQCAIAEYLIKQPEAIDELKGFYQVKRDFFRTGLMNTTFKLLPTKATYFQLIDYTDVTNFGKFDDVAFVKHLTTQVGVAAIPLSPFYVLAPVKQKIIRFCFSKKNETLRLALERLNQYFGVA